MVKNQPYKLQSSLKFEISQQDFCSSVNDTPIAGVPIRSLKNFIFFRA
jgi:hypothetical protein